MNYSQEEAFEDDVLKLEPKVVMALSRLQRGRSAGVGGKQLVEYLSTTYDYLDGDLDSQVTTALLSCVKSGIVCALGSGRYRLVGPSPKTMISSCITRSAHGAKCNCLSVVNNFTVSVNNTCCFIKSVGNRTKAQGPCKKAPKQKPAPKPKTGKPRQKARVRVAGRKPVSKCMSKMVVGTQAGEILGQERNSFLECSYCFELHPSPSDFSFLSDHPSEVTQCPPSKPPPPKSTLGVVES